jgi:hypothetical protein
MYQVLVPCTVSHICGNQVLQYNVQVVISMEYLYYSTIVRGVFQWVHSPTIVPGASVVKCYF